MNLPVSRPQPAAQAGATPPSTRCLLRRSSDLRGLYRRAARTCEPGLRMVLEENGQVLDLLVTELLQQVDCAPRSGVRGSWRGGMHRRVTDWVTRLAANRDLAWIRVLTFHESALLQAFEAAIAALPSQQAMLLQRQLPRLHAIHLDMHHLAAGSAPR